MKAQGTLLILVALSTPAILRQIEAHPLIEHLESYLLAMEMSLGDRLLSELP